MMSEGWKPHSIKIPAKCRVSLEKVFGDRFVGALRVEIAEAAKGKTPNRLAISALMSYLMKSVMKGLQEGRQKGGQCSSRVEVKFVVKKSKEKKEKKEVDDWLEFGAKLEKNFQTFRRYDLFINVFVG